MIKFTYTREEKLAEPLNTIEYRIDDDATWIETVEIFEKFLRSIGYQLPDGVLDIVNYDEDPVSKDEFEQDLEYGRMMAFEQNLEYGRMMAEFEKTNDISNQ